MSERPEKRMVEFIESYWTGGELGSDYQWNDNHGELIRCKDCKFSEKRETYNKEDEYKCKLSEYEGCFDYHHKNWFCADGERK